MIIGGLTGTPAVNRLNYVLPVVRVDHVNGAPLDSGYMLASPMRGLVEGRPNRHPLSFGVSDGGELRVPTGEESEYESVNLGTKQESSG